MTDLSRARKEVEAAWRSFVLDGAPPESVRPEIRRSWQRVRGELRVDPALRICPRTSGHGLVRAGSDGAPEVVSRIVSRFAERLAPDGHVVAYFDRDGVMRALAGDAATRRRLDDVNFAPGAC